MTKITGLRVVVFGSTGTAGFELVRQALADSRIAEVLAVTRRPLRLEHAKLREIMCERFDNLEAIRGSLVDVDACFYCLGISQSQAQNEAHYRKVTLEYPLAAAKILLETSPEFTFHYISGGGTDRSGRSMMMWARVKGDAEKALEAAGLRRLFCHRPGYIHPEPDQLKGGAMNFLGRALFPVLKTVAPGSAIRALELGRAMIEATCSERKGAILENRDLLALARGPA